ncbi:MAG TPA: hypothetical protein VJR89_08355, partial [Polyangiales bacterium]|nr:hypothetical protein [Polyangiales bacterium]
MSRSWLALSLLAAVGCREGVRNTLDNSSLHGSGIQIEGQPASDDVGQVDVTIDVRTDADV